MTADDVYAALVAEAEAGRTLDAGAWAGRHPEWADDIRAFCRDLGDFAPLLGLPPAADATQDYRSAPDADPLPAAVLGSATTTCWVCSAAAAWGGSTRPAGSGPTSWSP